MFHVQQIFPRKSCTLWDNVENYVTARQATGDNITWHTCFACWIFKATKTHSEYVIIIAFPWQKIVSRKHLSVTWTCMLSVLFTHRSSFFENRCLGRAPWFVLFSFCYEQSVCEYRALVKWFWQGGNPSTRIQPVPISCATYHTWIEPVPLWWESSD